jgi:hypothetical protein
MSGHQRAAVDAMLRDHPPAPSSQSVADIRANFAPLMAK